jgi:hypothetical protein
MTKGKKQKTEIHEEPKEQEPKFSFDQKTVGTLLLLVLVIMSGVSYYMFLNFKNTVPQVSENVKGAKDSWTFEYPIPENSIRLASNRTAEIQQLTIQSERSPEEVHSFYQNVFFDQNFRLESESQDDGFTTKVYVSDGKTATVVASGQTGETYSIASIEIVNR